MRGACRKNRDRDNRKHAPAQWIMTPVYVETIWTVVLSPGAPLIVTLQVSPCFVAVSCANVKVASLCDTVTYVQVFVCVKPPDQFDSEAVTLLVVAVGLPLASRPR